MLVNVDNILSLVSNSSDTHNICYFVICLTMVTESVLLLFLQTLSCRNGFNVCIVFYVTLNRLEGEIKRSPSVHCVWISER